MLKSRALVGNRLLASPIAGVFANCNMMEKGRKQAYQNC